MKKDNHGTLILSMRRRLDLRLTGSRPLSSPSYQSGVPHTSTGDRRNSVLLAVRRRLVSGGLQVYPEDVAEVDVRLASGDLPAAHILPVATRLM
jgi:hypothetical protein